MLSVLWDTRQYFFWLAVISLLCFVLERVVPWRREQKAFRNQFGQDLVWLVFNGHYLGILFATLTAWFMSTFDPSGEGASTVTLVWVKTLPLWSQFAIFISMEAKALSNT